jgi:hypothetical protein
MRELLVEARDGTRELLRPRRSAWARDNVSLTAVADRVATAICQVLPTAAGKLEGASGLASDSSERPIS